MLVALIATGVWLLANTAVCAPPEPRESAPEIRLTSNQPQLFVDNFLVQRMEGVWRQLNRVAKRRKPVLIPDRPWEGYLVLQPGTVTFDEEDQLFKMWYITLATKERPYVEQYLCYATSKDGLNWEKPELGVVEFRGSRANNIVLKWCNWTHCVIKDPEDPDPNRRYKLAYFQRHDEPRTGIWVAFSPDGIHWTTHPDNPIVPAWACSKSMGHTRTT